MAAALMLGSAGATADAAGSHRPGSLDASFGRGGRVFARAPKAVSRASFGSAQLEGDGDLVLELQREVPEKEGGVREIERRLPNGGLDASFGKGGRVRVGLGSGLAVRPDGSILVGTSSCGSVRGSLLLLDSRGDRATSFGTGGCAPRLEFSSSYISPSPDGSIYVGGDVVGCSPCGRSPIYTYEPAIAKLTSGGALEPTFGEGGIVRLAVDLHVEPEAAGSRSTDGIAPTADGGVVISAANLLVRLGSDGRLSPGFGEGGVVRLAHLARGLTQLPDGDLVVAATTAEYSFQADAQVAVSRFLPDGAIDQSFGVAGTSEPEGLGNANQEALVVALAPGGGVFLAGSIDPGSECHVDCDTTPFLVRLDAGGGLDQPYGNAADGWFPTAPSLTTSSDGAAIVTGADYRVAGREGAVAVATNPAGGPDPGFGEDGKVREVHLQPPSLEASGIALGAAGKVTILAEGSSGDSDYSGFLIGLRRDGRQTEGVSGGVSETAARGPIEPVRGGIVSSEEESESRSWLHAARRDGTPLRRYAGMGEAALPHDFQPYGIDRGPRGGTVVLGTMVDEREMAIYRVGPTGRPVRGFGHRGLVRVPFGREQARAYAATTAGGGAIIVAGFEGLGTTAVKLLPNGRLDRHFGRRGRVTGLLGPNAYGTQIASLDGGAVIGSTSTVSGPKLAGLVRIDRRGHVVRGFGRAGAVRPPVEGRLLDLFAHRGRIVVVDDNEYAPHSPGGVELRAYLANGVPDPGYGHHGLAIGGVGQRRYFHPVAAAQEPDGMILVAGAAWDGEISQVEVMRFR